MAFRVTGVAAAYDPADAYSRPYPPLALGALPPNLRVGVPLPAQRMFFGDAAAEAAYAADLDSARSPRRHHRADSISSRSTPSPACFTRGPGSPSATPPPSR